MNDHERRPPDEMPSYWNEETALGSIFYRHEERPVTLRSHVAEERFFGRGSESLFTLAEREGLRIYVQSHFFFVPTTPPYRRIADSQAWFYPADAALVLWEVLVAPQCRQHQDPREDYLLRQLWLAYERWLVARFPAATHLLTTWEDEYLREEWGGFLATVGYHKTMPATFVKAWTPGRKSLP